MKSAKFYAAGIVLLLLFIGCNKKKGSAVVQDIQMESQLIKEKNKSDFENEPSNTLDSSATLSLPNSKTNNAQKPRIDWDKKIIKTANVTLELKNYNQYNQKIHNTIKQYGAYIAGEEQKQSDFSIENSIILKVPVDQFADLMNVLGGDSIKIIEKRISTEDVTAEFTDTKGRVEAKKEVRQQYLSLLKQAKNMKDILEVQNEVNGITEELEAASGRVKFLANQSAYSTIHLKYFQNFATINMPKDETSFSYELINAFSSGAKGIGNLVIGLATIWPLLLIGIALLIGYKKWYSTKKN
jgi:Domain of unknown function (DUF4349)